MAQRQHPPLVVLVLGASAIAWFATHLPPPITAERRQANIKQAKAEAKEAAARAQQYAEADAARQAAQAAKAKRNAEICRMKAHCAAYAKARQECATDGNFALCLEVKLGKDFEEWPNNMGEIWGG